MIELIINNYKTILGIIVFLIFATIGYVIESIKNKKDTNEPIEEDNIPELEEGNDK